VGNDKKRVGLMNLKDDKVLFREAITKFSKPAYWPSLVYLFSMAAMLMISIFQYYVYGNVTAVFISFLLFGIFQYYAVVAIHEAIHYGLVPNKKVNDILGSFMALLVTFHYGEIKNAHLAHHKYLGSSIDDPDYPFYIKDSVNQKISVLGLLLRPLKGLLYKRTNLNKGQKYNARKGIIRILFFQIILLFLLWQFSIWLAFAWVASLASIPGFLMHVRLVFEHSGLIVDEEPLVDQRLGARTHVRPNTIIGGLFFDVFRIIVSPFSFNYHHEHHLLMTIPYYNLWKFNKLLIQSGYYANKSDNTSNSYYKTFKKNFSF
jgi:fatty acid desaturase